MAKPSRGGSSDDGRKEWAWLVAGTLASYPIGLALGAPWLLPLLNTAPAYVVLVRCLRRGDRRGAVLAMLGWAGTLAVVATTCFALWPAPVDGLVLNGPAYRDEMFRFIRTGEGREGSLSLFLPQHVVHLAVFVALCLATASALGILLGAVLMNFIAFYVASLAGWAFPAGRWWRSAGSPGRSAGWPRSASWARYSRSRSWRGSRRGLARAASAPTSWPPPAGSWPIGR